MKVIETPKFQARFLLPKYWLTWLGVGILYTISWLPYRLQLGMGRGLGRLFYNFVPKRANIARRNVELCFPEKSADELEDLVRRNMENTGIAFFETGMAWWWPDWRIRRKLHVHGAEHIKAPLAEGKGVLMLMFHFLSLEVHARMHGFVKPAVGLYRPHNNAVMEFLQTRGRGRSNKYLIPRTDVRSMLQALNQGEIAGYLPDQDYGRKRTVFVPFFEVAETSTTTGTTLFAGNANCVVVPSTCFRRADGSGYDLSFYPQFENFPTGDELADATRINKMVEFAVQQAPEQYLWVHRRFKTRPNPGDPDLYQG
ncbi:lipid A biosynthesis lauroyl acyltransferase [Pseudidiomarina salinarum]|uniref:Lipid A biosynthesis acyltransferase n=1 Tax=Pseudidiomarina salinarum TaxID=435908 RepID=A0A094ISV9_9GAMM|nr:LpxL/LpxP family Kdo(2)-lipid IV(A) lauroyl/palmitoleoyl acyltransferase [Pseudidiomarina salinarum]KFZ30237.1 lipid A biosynthesis lauroyl acyltransferase [Pseudidiomarina salinarum]RUO69937.1 lipid A biosynthesis lauroyl acyltransferase [Pseudidiomarina salinarum]